MCKLSKREKEVLEMRLGCADDTVAAVNLGVSKEAVRVYKTRARRKIFLAKRFLKMMKRYNRILFPERIYKIKRKVK